MVWCPRGKVSVGICITCLCIDTHVSCIHTLCIYVYNEHICTYMSFLYSYISMFQASNLWGYRRISSGYIYIYIYIYMWRFLKIGVPPVLIHFIFGFFHEINHPFLGIPIYGNPHIHPHYWYIGILVYIPITSYIPIIIWCVLVYLYTDLGGYNSSRPWVKKSATVANPSHLVSGSNPWPNGHMPYIYIYITNFDVGVRSGRV